MTKYLNPTFNSRPSSDAYRDNYDQTFGKEEMVEAGDTTAKQVIVMRTDLGMRKGKMIAQGAHASMKVLLDHFRFAQHAIGTPKYEPIPHWAAMTEWLDCGFTKICVRVDSLRELLTILKKAREAKLPVALVVDSGRTEFHGAATPTCLAIGPAQVEDIDEITGELRLL